MTWNTINRRLVVVVQHGKAHTKQAYRPFDAMPRWFKHWVKQLNEHFGLAANLKQKSYHRSGYQRHKPAAPVAGS